MRAIGIVLCSLLPVLGCRKEPAPAPAAPAPDVKAAGPASAPAPRPRKYPEPITNRNPSSLLGGERGMDHVGIAVRDLEGARATFQNKLGFGGGQPGTLPNGLRNVNLYFGDTTYLELLTVTDERKNPWVAGFLQRHEKGAMFLVLCVFSYRETRAFLAGRGLSVGDPLPGRIEAAGLDKSGRPMWHTFFFKPSPLPGDPLYFIAYDRGIRSFILHKIKKPEVRRRAFSHPNTALGLKAAWVAVRDLVAAEGAYRSIGLPAGRRFELPALDATGLEVPAGEGAILLLQPRRRKSPLARFVSRRGEGIVGVSVEVERLETARALLAEKAGLKLSPDDGLFGRRVIVPAEAAHDVNVELFQRPDAPR